MSEVDLYFDRLRLASFATDPQRVAQQLQGIGDGNIQPSSWYADHNYSSFVGQTNLLADPTMESIRSYNQTTALSTGFTPLGSYNATKHYWAKISTLASGGYGTFGLNSFNRGDPKNPFSSDAWQIQFGIDNSTITYTFEASTLVIGTGRPQLPYLVGSLRLAALLDGINWVGWSAMTADLAIVNSAVTLASSTYDLKALFSDRGGTSILPQQELLWVSLPGPLPAGYVDGNYEFSLRLTGTSSQASPPAFQLFVGEPTLHMNYQPSPLPYTPQLGGYISSEVQGGFVLGTTAGFIDAAVQANTIGPAFKIRPNGTMEFASDAAPAAADTRLYRSGAKTITVDDVLAGGASLVVTPSASQTLVAATPILANANIIQVTCTGAVTSTAAPTIANGSSGLVVTIMNVGTGTLTLQDQGTLASSNLRLTAATVALAPRQSIQLLYNTTIEDWVQIGNKVAVL